LNKEDIEMASSLPSRLHHTAYVVKNLEATRHFYEDILGCPLVATWYEQEELFGAERTYCNCFLVWRIAATGLVEPQTYILEHCYCRSVYVNDPDGMIVEFTRDAAEADKINAARAKDAHSELKRWLAGDRRPNNEVRHFASEGAH
jgi:glyoxylase I family protein